MSQISDFLDRLDAGEEILLWFPSSSLREAFRQAIYKEKKRMDDLSLLSDDEFEVRTLRFTRIQKNNLIARDLQLNELVPISDAHRPFGCRMKITESKYADRETRIFDLVEGEGGEDE